MKAVIMAGGEGTRLRPVTCRRPKPMAPIANRPLMEHILGLIRKAGVDTAYATVHYLADEIEAYFGDGARWGVNLHYSVEDTPLGTAGSVKRLDHELDGTFLVVSGDALTDIDLAKAVAFHKQKKAVVTIVLARVAQPLEFGVVITEEDGSVQRFLEKPGWGEVFSDTVNTGIYVLEPEVLAQMQPGQVVDFSRDLFPALMEQGKPLYGYVAEGYWSDVGSLSQYMQAHVDALERKVSLDIPGEQIAPGIWVGQGTRIHPTARIEAPLVIGRNCIIGEQATILPLTSLGGNCVVEAGATLERSIIWENVYVGRGAHLHGAIVGAGTLIKAQAHVHEGAVVGDSCLLGEGTVIYADVKLWPHKVTDTGAKVTMSLVWGAKWPGSLFTGPGVRGLANVEITPEFATRLGAAFGASLERGTQVVTSRDIHPVSRMTKRAMIAGLMSVGANILDLRTMPAPVSRHAALVSGAAGGVHVSLWAQNPDEVLIEFFDGRGRALGRAAERKLEGIFFREDFRRCHRDEVGNLEFLGRAVEAYTSDFLGWVDADAIRDAQPRIVVDYSHGALSLFMPVLLGRMGCEAIALNAFVDPTREPVPWQVRCRELGHVSSLVIAYRARCGVVIDGQGERLAMVDETGHPLSGDELLNVMTYLALGTVRRGRDSAEPTPPKATKAEAAASLPRSRKVAVPVTATSAIERTCEALGGECVRTKADRRSLAEACNDEDVIFGGDPRGGFIFPQMHAALDAMASLGKLLEMLVRQQSSLSCVRESLRPVYKAEQSVECAWERKGAIMREMHAHSSGMKVEHIDGVKVWRDGSWVLVLPDASGPLVHVIAEGGSADEAASLVSEHVSLVQTWAQSP